MTIPDLIKDFIDTSRERLKTPISGAFLWSFIIYNWRPFFLLIFSDKSIEDKIIVINHEYCNLLAILVPTLLAIFYTKSIPWIMLQIDNDLAETKRKRIDNIYDSRSHTMERKISIAKQDFKLKNAESGNREIEDYLNQIESLKNTNKGLQDSIKNINDSSTVTINELNNQFNLLQTDYERVSERLKFSNLRITVISNSLHLDEPLADLVAKTADLLTYREYMFLKKLVVNDDNVITAFPSRSADLVDELNNKGVIIKDRIANIIRLTEIGDVLYQTITSL